jgi:hypothetical protein
LWRGSKRKRYDGKIRLRTLSDDCQCRLRWDGKRTFIYRLWVINRLVYRLRPTPTSSIRVSTNEPDTGPTPRCQLTFSCACPHHYQNARRRFTNRPSTAACIHWCPRSVLVGGFEEPTMFLMKTPQCCAVQLQSAFSSVGAEALFTARDCQVDNRGGCKPTSRMCHNACRTLP